MDLGLPASLPLTVLVALLVLILPMLAVSRRLMALEARMSRIRLLETKLDLLMQHAGIKFDPFADVPPDVAEALRQGQKITAIKLYRQRTGSSLREAKDFVEELQRTTGLA